MYSTIADVQIAAGGDATLRELSDVNDSGAINRAAVESAIVEADAMIDSVIHPRLAVPLAHPAPPVIRALSAAIAVFVLKGRRRGMLAEVDIQLHESRMKQLDTLATGRTSFGVTPSPTKSELLRYESSDRPSDKAVSRANLKGFC